MLVTASKETLCSPLADVIHAADQSKSPNNPLLGAVLLKAVNGKLILTCSDAAITARAVSNDDLKVDQEGTVAVDVRRLYDLIRAIPDKSQLSISLVKSELIVKAQRSRFKLPSHEAESFPKMATARTSLVEISLAGSRLIQMIESVVDCASTTDVRAFTQGVLISLENGAVWMVATDGNRMGITQEPIKGSEPIPPCSFIIPKKSVKVIRQLLPLDDTAVSLSISEGELKAVFGEKCGLVTKGIDGKYPDWRGVVPKNESRVRVGAKELQEAIGMIAATVYKPGAAVSIEFGEKEIRLRSTSSDAEVSLPCTNGDGAKLEISCQMEFLRSAIQSIRAEKEVVIGFSGPGKALTVRGDEKEHPVWVIMPLKN